MSVYLCVCVCVTLCMFKWVRMYVCGVYVCARVRVSEGAFMCVTLCV